jgi:hypothetical protein
MSATFSSCLSERSQNSEASDDQEFQASMGFHRIGGPSDLNWIKFFKIDSPCPTSTFSEDDFVSPVRRKLRSAPRLKMQSGTGFYDNDDTGDWDPEEEARKLKATKVRKAARAKEKAVKEAETGVMQSIEHDDNTIYGTQSTDGNMEGHRWEDMGYDTDDEIGNDTGENFGDMLGGIDDIYGATEDDMWQIMNDELDCNKEVNSDEEQDFRRPQRIKSSEGHRGSEIAQHTPIDPSYDEYEREFLQQHNQIRSQKSDDDYKKKDEAQGIFTNSDFKWPRGFEGTSHTADIPLLDDRERKRIQLRNQILGPPSDDEYDENESQVLPRSSGRRHTGRYNQEEDEAPVIQSSRFIRYMDETSPLGAFREPLSKEFVTPSVVSRESCRDADYGLPDSVSATPSFVSQENLLGAGLGSLGLVLINPWPMNSIDKDPDFKSLNHLPVQSIHQNQEIKTELSSPPGDVRPQSCRMCTVFGNKCTLEDDPYRYPCGDCEEIKADCELSIVPTRKSDCIECRNNGLTCIYSDENGKDSKYCNQCEKRNRKCLAGPLNPNRPLNPLKRRYSEDMTHNETDLELEQMGIVPKKARKHVSYEICGKDEPYCSAQHKELNQTHSTCRSTKRNSDGALRRRKVSKRGANNKTVEARGLGIQWNHDGGIKEEDDEMIDFADRIPQARTRKIKTNFTHPIMFNHVPTRSLPCHFCSNVAYGVFGQASRSIKAIDPGTGRGYQEIGPREGTSTRMCNDCTTVRMATCCCEGHDIRPMEGVSEEPAEEWYEFLDNLHIMPPSNEPDTPVWSVEETEVKVCSICMDQAIFECCTVVVLDPGTDIEVSSSPCDLKLCRVCRGKMADYGGSLERLISEAKDDTLNYPEETLRADVLFLSERGQLMRRARKDFGGE